MARKVWTRLVGGSAGDREAPGSVPIGGIIAYAGTVLPTDGVWDWADGGLIDRTTYATFYTRQGGAAHSYNGGVDPGTNKVRKPDKRGRMSMGADNFGQGAAGRITVANKLLGQNGGSERVTLAAGESGVNGSGVTGTDSPDHAHTFISQAFSLAGPGGVVYGVQAGTAIGTSGANARHSHALTARTADASHQNLPLYEADNYIVRIA